MSEAAHMPPIATDSQLSIVKVRSVSGRLTQIGLYLVLLDAEDCHFVYRFLKRIHTVSGVLL